MGGGEVRARSEDAWVKSYKWVQDEVVAVHYSSSLASYTPFRLSPA